MASVADIEAGMNAARQKLSEYTQTSPTVIKEEIDKAWHPLISGAANEVSQMKQDFLPRYFTGMMNEGYGMGTSEADLSPTQKLSQMGSTLGQFSGDLGRGQAVVDYLGGSVKDIYAQALDALKWKTGLAQQEYSNWFDQWSLERQLEEQARARAAAAAQSNSILDAINALLKRGPQTAQPVTIGSAPLNTVASGIKTGITRTMQPLYDYMKATPQERVNTIGNTVKNLLGF